MKNVALIIPVYNVEKYLDASLSSALNQSYKNIEIIVVDDGSTDNSYNILAEYLDKDERIHIIRKENGGLSSARNAGISYIFGEEINGLFSINSRRKLPNIDYVQFFDSDDILNKYCVEISVILMGDSDFTAFNFSYFIDGTDIVQKGMLDFHIEDFSSPVDSRDFLINNVRHFVSWAWRGMIKKDVLKNLRFKENMEYEDALFGTKLFYYSKYVQLIPESLLLYRIRRDSIMDMGGQRVLPKFITKLFNRSDQKYMKDYFKFHSYLTLYEELYKDENLRFMAPKLYDTKFLEILDEDPLGVKERLKIVENKYDYKISIIIPVYPDIKEITELVKKLYSLDKEKECEIIIINDGCINEIDEDILALDNIKYYNNIENKGRSYSRNLGIEKSLGEYITFVDSDDFVKDNFIDIIKQNLNENETDMYTYKYIIPGYSSMDFLLNKCCYEKINKISKLDVDAVKEFLSYLGNCSIGGKVFRSNIIKENNLKFESDIHYAEDFVFILDFMNKSKTVYHSSEIIYEYNFKNKYSIDVIHDNFEKIINIQRFSEFKQELSYFLMCNYFVNIRNLDKSKELSKYTYLLEKLYIDSIEKDDTIIKYKKEVFQLLNNPKISIIIPVYNVEKYVEMCIKSVINQTYKNLEIIVINDGTKDNSMDIVEKYKDDRFIIINQENKGLSSARNAGLNIATGKYVYFLDSDDWIDEGYIEEIKSKFDSDTFDAVCNVNHILYFDNYVTRDIGYTIKEDIILNKPKCGEFYNPCGICYFMFRLDFLNENNIRFIEGSNNEDVGFQALCAPFIKKALFFSGTCNYNVMKRSDSITANYNNNFQIEVCDQFDGIVEFYKKYNINYGLPYFLILSFLISYKFDNEKEVLEKLISIMKKHNLVNDLKQIPKDLLIRNNMDIY